jgi:hypothetical protein
MLTCLLVADEIPAKARSTVQSTFGYEVASFYTTRCFRYLHTKEAGNFRRRLRGTRLAEDQQGAP